MKQIKQISLIIMIGIWGSLGILSAQNKKDKKATSQMTYQFAFQDPSLSIEERVEDLIEQMTLEEKASQMLMSSVAIDRLGVPEYDWWNEALHGVARAGRATIFPQAVGMAASFDTDLMFQVATAISDEARAKYNIFSSKEIRDRYKGLTFWSPNVNIFRDPRWGRGQETYGEDPYLTTRMGVAFVQGLQGDDKKYLKTAAMGKHFAVHNGPEADRHTFDAVVNQKDLWETYLPAFEALVKEANVEGIMGAYNRTNGAPCCAHPYLMQEVLREQWGFKGYFVSDCWALVDFYKGHMVSANAKEAAALAVNSGCNLNCGNTYEQLVESVKAGLTSEKMLDSNLRELLPTRFKLGMFDPIGSTPYDNYGPEKIRSAAHVKLTRDMAASSMVLLKNDRNILPLNTDIKDIFVTGPTATHAQALLANYFGVSENLVSFLEGIVAAGSDHTSVKYSQGTLLDIPNRNPEDWSTETGKISNVTIACLGISQLIEGEEGESIASAHKGDRVSLKLPENQLEYIRKLRTTSENLVVVLTAGSALDCKEVYELADAIIYAWYPGEQGGNALADILFGKVSPSGRMPITIPYSVDDLPPYEDYSLKGRTYRYMEKEVMIPFGFGLSYTTFEYGDIETQQNEDSETIRVITTVKNTGEVASNEIVQLYIKDNEASVDVPFYALKSFKKIHLKAGETKSIKFDLRLKDFEIVNNEGKSVLEAGEFTIYVGGSIPSQRSLSLGASPYKERIINIQ